MEKNTFETIKLNLETRINECKKYLDHILTTEDLKKLSNLGNNNVYRLKKEIQEELEANGYILPKGLIPMCEVVKKLKIDIDYLNRLANLS